MRTDVGVHFEHQIQRLALVAVECPLTEHGHFTAILALRDYLSNPVTVGVDRRDDLFEWLRKAWMQQCGDAARFSLVTLESILTPGAFTPVMNMAGEIEYDSRRQIEQGPALTQQGFVLQAGGGIAAQHQKELFRAVFVTHCAHIDVDQRAVLATLAGKRFPGLPGDACLPTLMQFGATELHIEICDLQRRQLFARVARQATSL